MEKEIVDPLITTIILTYQRPQLLKRALSSVLKQTYPHFQVCVYDNASGDETEEIVREFLEKDSRVKYHCHPQNIGMIANYEYALKEVKTPYFSLLSDDDLILPWFFEEALKGLQSYPEAAFSACSALIMSDKGKIIRVPLDMWPREGCFNPPDGLLEMISKYPVPTCILFRGEVIQETPIDMDNALTWDCDFLLQIAARYPIAINKRPCGIFLHHDSSYSNAQDLKKWESSHRHLSRRIELTASLSPGVKKVAIQRFGSDLKAVNRALALQHLFEKRFKEAFDDALVFRKNYGMSATFFVLLVLAKSCQYFPPLIYLLRLIRSVKKMRKKEGYLSYTQYAKWLGDS
jgi:glycosyltransferase involved in cell wall biosynthesis